VINLVLIGILYLLGACSAAGWVSDQGYHKGLVVGVAILWPLCVLGALGVWAYQLGRNAR